MRSEISRRALLATGGALLLAGCGTSAASTRHSSARSGQEAAVTPEHVAYGKDSSQFGELSRPTDPGAAESIHTGTIVIVHGGFWQQQYGLELGRPLAADLVSRGYTCWNLEYRRVGGGGGWPATFDDVAAGIDHLADLDVDTSHVVAVGHSAGGQLAVWAAGRSTLAAGAPGAAPRVLLRGVVSQAGVLDLAVAARTGVGGAAEVQLMGGTPDTYPDRYRIGDPIEQLPITAPVLCVHSRADQNVPFAQSTAYVAAARKAGDPARLHEVQGDHFTLIDPTSPAWALVRDALPALLAGRLPA